MRSGLQFSFAGAVFCALCFLFVAAPMVSAQTANQYRFSGTNGASIVPGTTPVTGFTCVNGGTPGDDCVAPVTLPFSYTLYGRTFTQAFVSSNGNLQVDSANSDYGLNEVCFPVPQFNNVIAAHFSDLTIGGAGEGIFTSVSGSAPNRIFNIEWRASNLGQPAGSLNFELRLYEGQLRFDIIYGTVPGSGSEATVGVQSSTGNSGAFTQYECRTGGLRNGLMLRADGVIGNSGILEGQVFDGDGNPLSGVTITLSGGVSATLTTDANGQYLFEGLSYGGNYTVTATQNGSNFFPSSRTFAFYPGNETVNFIRTVLPAAGQMLISEFRLRGQVPSGGTTGERDEFVEIYNNTDTSFVVNTADGSSGWSVVSSGTGGAEVVGFIIPNGTVLPARSHYLAGNGSGYSLSGSAAPDTFFAGDIPDNSGIALVSTANAANYATSLLDAVGFTTETNTFFRESTGLSAITADNGQFSFVRRMPGGTPQDTNNNGNDFILVSPNAASFGSPSTLGAPGPENTGSPIQRNARIKAALVDSQCGGFGAATTACARVRVGTAVTNGAFGTLAIRRRFTNTTGSQVTRLRFRIVDVTTLGNFQSGQADLRALTSSDIAVTGSQGSVFINGLTLEQTSLQPSGGGINSALRAGTITFSAPLAQGASINVEFRLGVQTNGGFRFFVNVEAVTGAAAATTGSASKGEGIPAKRATPTKQATRTLRQP